MGIARLYGRRPVRVSDRVVLEGARAVAANGGPTYTQALSAGELLCLLARRKLAPARIYEVPQIMGPVKACKETVRNVMSIRDMRATCLEIVGHMQDSGYLPECLGRESENISLESALLALACDAAGLDLGAVKSPRLTVDAIPGFSSAAQEVSRLKDWRIHAPDFGQESVSKYFRWQAWTLKPAFRADEYGPGVETGTHLNPALPFAMGSHAAV